MEVELSLGTAARNRTEFSNLPKPPCHLARACRSQNLGGRGPDPPDNAPTLIPQSDANDRQDPDRSLRGAVTQAHGPPERDTRIILALYLHFSLRAKSRVHTGPYIEFDGQDQEIAPISRSVVTVLFHPFRNLRDLDHSPNLTWLPNSGHFRLKSVGFCTSVEREISDTGLFPR